MRKKLDEHRRQQRRDTSDRDDEGERGQDPLDHLPDVEETAPGALASSPALLGGGGGAASGSAIACLGAEADTPEERALGKRAVSPVGSTAVVVQVVAELTQLLP